MLDLNKISEGVLSDIACNLGWEGDGDINNDAVSYLNEIETMKPEQAFRRWLQWHGIVGFAELIVETLDELRAAEIKDA